MDNEYLLTTTPGVWFIKMAEWAYITTQFRVFQKLQRYQGGNYVQTQVDNLHDEVVKTFSSWTIAFL